MAIIEDKAGSPFLSCASSVPTYPRTIFHWCWPPLPRRCEAAAVLRRESPRTEGSGNKGGVYRLAVKNSTPSESMGTRSRRHLMPIKVDGALSLAESNLPSILIAPPSNFIAHPEKLMKLCAKFGLYLLERSGKTPSINK